MNHPDRPREYFVDDFTMERLLKRAPPSASIVTTTNEDGERYLSRDPRTGRVVSQWAARLILEWQNRPARKRDKL